MFKRFLKRTLSINLIGALFFSSPLLANEIIEKIDLKSSSRFEDIVNNYYTDKNSVHSYLPVYQKLFGENKNIKNILEIGVQCGGSIELWSKYFPFANVFGIDIDLSLVSKELKLEDRENVFLFSGDAYTEEMISLLNEKSSSNFDLIIDDGPHTIESMVSVLKLYLPILVPNGVLIIEDLRDTKWAEVLMENLSDEDKKFAKVIDLRQEKNRWDDILFIIDRRDVRSGDVEITVDENKTTNETTYE